MKSAFKEVFIKADSLTVDLNEVIKTAARDIKIAYILHDKNAGAESHYHIFLDYGAIRVDDNAAMQLLNVCNRCVVSARSKNWTDIKRYMVHTHDYEYSLSDMLFNYDKIFYVNDTSVTFEDVEFTGFVASFQAYKDAPQYRSYELKIMNPTLSYELKDNVSGMTPEYVAQRYEYFKQYGEW